MNLEADNIIKAKVELIEPMGSFILLRIALGKMDMVAQVDSNTHASLNNEIDLVVDMEKMHLFTTEPPHLSLNNS